MKIVRNLSLSIVLLFSKCFSAEAQHNPGDSTYLARLFWGDEDSRSNLVFFGFNYLSTPKTEAFAAKGTNFCIGLNIVRFFNDKFAFGPFLETKQSNGGLRQHLSSDFINGFNQVYIPIDDPETAKLESETFYNAVNGVDGFYIRGNKFWNVGIALSPFPDRYGSVMLKVSKGSQSVSFGGLYDDQLYVNDDGLYMDLYLKRNFSIELAMRPFTFGTPKHVTITGMETAKDALRLISTSLYFESLQLTEGKFRTTDLSSFIDPSFFTSKHSKMYNFGFKVGIGLW